MGVFGSIRDWLYEPVVTAAVAAAVVAPVESAVPKGADGVQAFGGWVQSGEASPKLQGQQKWITYANAVNSAIVATGVRYFGNLLAGTEWHCEPNKAGGAGADRGVEIARAGLFDAQLQKPWPMIVRKAATGYRIFGFSLHATGIRARSDGMIVFSDLAHRPQFTISEWLRDDRKAPWRAVVQRTFDGFTEEIPLNECLYCVDDTLGDSPDGVGLLRHVIALVDRLDRYQTLEWLAYEGDMAGTPIARAPLGELFAEATGNADAKKAQVDAKTDNLLNVVRNRVKSPEKLNYLLLDSATYKTSTDPQQISAIQKWALELVKSVTNGLPNIHEVIKRLQFEIARVLGVDFALVGAEGGSYAMHEDKTSMFATNLSVTLAEMGSFATNQLARRLVMLNGLDPDTCTPKLVAEPISSDAIESVTKSLMQLQLAKLHPADPARDVLRKRMRLPPEDPATLGDRVKAWEKSIAEPDPKPKIEPSKEAA